MKTKNFVWNALTFCALFLMVSIFVSCEKEQTEPIAEPDGATATVNVYMNTPMQKLTMWGHDIKQPGKDNRMTDDVCKALFVNGKFSVLRIPLYCNDHNVDGTVKATNDYASIISAIKRAKANGNPKLYASVKITWPEDTSLTNNTTWGPFLGTDGLIHSTNYAKCWDKYIEYIKAQTGVDVSYIGIVCEQYERVPSYKYKQVIEKMVKKPTVVGPDLWGPKGGSAYWDANISAVVQIKGSHNMGLDWDQATSYQCAWNTELHDYGTCIQLLRDMHQSYYIGKCYGTTFWGDDHITTSTLGKCRNAIINNSGSNLIKTSYDVNCPTIAFKISDTKAQIIYSSKLTTQFNFDKNIITYPSGATNKTTKGFSMPATTDSSYKSASVLF